MLVERNLDKKSCFLCSKDSSSCSIVLLRQSYIVGIDTRTGWNISGSTTGIFNMQFAFTLSGVKVYIGEFLMQLSQCLMYLSSQVYTISIVLTMWSVSFLSNNNSSNSSPGSTLPIMYLVKDYDDSGAAGVTDLQQYSTQTMWQLGNAHGRDGIKSIKMKPNVDVALYQGVTSDMVGVNQCLLILLLRMFYITGSRLLMIQLTILLLPLWWAI